MNFIVWSWKLLIEDRQLLPLVVHFYFFALLIRAFQVGDSYSNGNFPTWRFFKVHLLTTCKTLNLMIVRVSNWCLLYSALWSFSVNPRSSLLPSFALFSYCMISVIAWKWKKRHNFALDKWFSILKKLVIRTQVRTNFHRKNMPHFLRFIAKNDVKRFDWFENLTSFLALNRKKCGIFFR